MANENTRIVIFVHGWSVTNTNTYGQFPDRLRAEARRHAGIDIDVRNIWLGKYVSFHDEVKVSDIARGFEAAIRDQLGDLLNSGKRFICITHSTGGPVIREWWDQYYISRGRHRSCPMSHLIMLAPANFGSALAQLGKARIGRLKSWFGGIEPGMGVLNWLELGSSEAWGLNRKWFDYPDISSGRGRTFVFSLTGQCIDHALYDHLNSYTGEIGSDGVVRVASANLNSVYVKLVQREPEKTSPRKRYFESQLDLIDVRLPQRTAFAVIPGKAHSGSKIGIMRSVRNDEQSHATLSAVLKCLMIETKNQYNRLCSEFEELSREVQENEIVEARSRLLLSGHQRIRDSHAMAIFRMVDDYGHPVDDYDLVFTAGTKDSPNRLPSGFLSDRQRNSRTPNHITFFFNDGALTGRAVPGYREGLKRNDELMGFKILARPDSGFAHYGHAILSAQTAELRKILIPNQTVMVDVELKRVIHEGTFRLTRNTNPESFKTVKPGAKIKNS